MKNLFTISIFCLLGTGLGSPVPVDVKLPTIGTGGLKGPVEVEKAGTNEGEIIIERDAIPDPAPDDGASLDPTTVDVYGVHVVKGGGEVQLRRDLEGTAPTIGEGDLTLPGGIEVSKTGITGGSLKVGRDAIPDPAPADGIYVAPSELEANGVKLKTGGIGGSTRRA